MTWRGRTSGMDRFLSCLPYALPMSAAVPLGVGLFAQVPGLELSYLLFALLNVVMGFDILPPFVSIRLVVWIALYALVVRNDRLRHFLRFNTMQALAIDLAITLVGLLSQLVAQALGAIAAWDTLALAISTAVFLATNVAFLYAVIQIVRGLYPEIPMLSEAAYHHTQ